LFFRWPARVNYALWLGTCIGGVIAAFTTVNWLALAVNVASGVVAAVLWWRRGHRRDRAPRAYGAKSRARVAALVAKAREAGCPCRVLRPVPGGAG
jgi:membrane protein implicated in regulation of membrane protease activity